MTRALEPSRRRRRSSQASPATKISSSTRPSTDSGGPAEGTDSTSQVLDGSMDSRTRRLSGPGTKGWNSVVAATGAATGSSVGWASPASSARTDTVDPEPPLVPGGAAVGVDVPAAVSGEHPPGVISRSVTRSDDAE